MHSFHRNCMGCILNIESFVCIHSIDARTVSDDIPIQWTLETQCSSFLSQWFPWLSLVALYWIFTVLLFRLNCYQHCQLSKFICTLWKLRVYGWIMKSIRCVVVKFDIRSLWKIVFGNSDAFECLVLLFDESRERFHFRKKTIFP